MVCLSALQTIFGMVLLHSYVKENVAKRLEKVFWSQKLIIGSDVKCLNV